MLPPLQHPTETEPEYIPTQTQTPPRPRIIGTEEMRTGLYPHQESSTEMGLGMGMGMRPGP